MPAGLGSLAATSVAMVSAGAIAVTPVAPPVPDVVAPAVQLAASSDWSEIFNNAAQGASDLVNSYFEAPFPILQQIVANQLGYLGELPDVGAIAEQIAINLARAITAPMAATTDTLDSRHTFLYNALPVIQQLPLINLLVEISPLGQQLLDFSTSHVSGVLLGLVGPLVGPAVILGTNLQSIIDDLSAGTPNSALTTLLSTPAQMVDAFLNGGVHVDITALADAFGPTIGVSFPDGVKLGIAFGGLFSPGGSIFNALDMDFHQDVLGLPIIRINLANGQGPGFIGSLIEMNKAIARAIGWGGSGSPLTPSNADAQRTTLAAVDEVPRSVASSRVATLTTPTPELDRKDTTAGDAAVGEATDAATDDEPVRSRGLRTTAETTSDELTTTPTTGGRHRANPDAEDVSSADSNTKPTAGSPKHAKETKADKPAKDSGKSDRGRRAA